MTKTTFAVSLADLDFIIEFNFFFNFWSSLFYPVQFNIRYRLRWLIASEVETYSYSSCTRARVRNARKNSKNLPFLIGFIFSTSNEGQILMCESICLKTIECVSFHSNAIELFKCPWLTDKYFWIFSYFQSQWKIDMWLLSLGDV